MKGLLFFIFLQLATSVHADDNIVKVMTLNIGHARADGASQLLQNEAQARSHLLRIVDVLDWIAEEVGTFCLTFGIGAETVEFEAGGQVYARIKA